MRKGCAALLVVLCAVALVMAPDAARASSPVPVLVLDGKGYGHGVGLSQWAARYMAEAGQSTAQILATFYPGTAIEQRAGIVRVSVLTASDRQAVLSFPSGGEVQGTGPGFPVQVGPGASVLVTFDGSYRVSPVVTAQAVSEPQRWNASGCVPFVNCPTTTTTTTPASTTTTTRPGGCGVLGCITTTTTTPRPPRTTTTTTAPGGGSSSTTTTTAQGSSTTPPPTAPGAAPASTTPVWAVPAGGGVVGVPARGRSYRGAIQANGAAGPLRLINQLDVETYLKGMGEVPGTWPIAAIGAQAVAARTYALRAMAASGEICDYDLCQVYIGAGNESAGQNAAVDATYGQVVTYAGALAAAVYSAEAGGVSATTFEGFGTPDGQYPYLTTVRYDTPDPLPWHTELALTDVASRFGYAGTVTAVQVSQAGPSGRALQLTLDGDRGPMTVTGRQFAASLGLRSTLFTTGTASAATAPPPPPDPTQLQALPDDAAAITAAAIAGPRVGTATETSTAAVTLDAARDLADQPATWWAVLLLAGITGGGLARFGPENLFWRRSTTLRVADRRQKGMLVGPWAP